MNAYIYQSALLCERCGSDACAKLRAAGKAPPNPSDESTYDSNDYPKGPLPDGGGEADTPQHCATCLIPLGNPLTPDGVEYVLDALGSAMSDEGSPGNIDLECEVKAWDGTYYEGCMRVEMLLDWADQVNDGYQHSLSKDQANILDEFFHTVDPTTIR